MSQQIQGAQRDFSYGEVDVELKRNDEHPARKGGLRQMSNMRILNEGGIQNRSGRRALFPITNGLTRTEKFTIRAGSNFKIGFGPNLVAIYDDNDNRAAVFSEQGNGALLPWVSTSDITSIVWVPLRLSIYITFGHAMRPQVITWDGVSTWSIADYAEYVNGSQKRTFFYRISPHGIAIQPSATTGSVTVTASDPVFTAGHVGTRIEYIGHQLLITAFTDSQHVTAAVEETLPPGQILTFSGGTPTFPLQSEVIGASSGARGIVTAIVGSTATVQVIPFDAAGGTAGFSGSELIVGTNGSQTTTGIAATTPQSVTLWDDEVMNNYRGYPASVFVDQFRLGFCDFPSVPGGIGWSAIDAPTDIYVDVSGSSAIFEIAPSNAQVLYVVPGPESSEFVFCDSKIYYIPITATNPLKPGSVAFQFLSGDGCAPVQPRLSQEVIVYANAGGNSLMSILSTGAYNRPFTTRTLSKYHQHLFSGIVAIAIPTADAQFNERYAYVLNANGSLVVGRYDLDGLVANEPKIGWGPWNGGGSTQWVSAWNGEVHFTSTYFGFAICERLDDTLYLDGGLPVNSAPASFAPPGGGGPLWFWANQTATLMDQVTRAMGTYQIDAKGFIVPQQNGGENLAAASLVAGQPWTSTIEPFVSDANPGTDVHQRMFPRRVVCFAAYVVHSTGFILGRLFSGRITPTSPALGTLMNFRRFPAWNQGDDPTKPPPSRETTERIWPLGYSFDPRVALIKDTPGPLTVLELGTESTI